MSACRTLLEPGRRPGLTNPISFSSRGSSPRFFVILISIVAAPENRGHGGAVARSSCCHKDLRDSAPRRLRIQRAACEIKMRIMGKPG
jgi:hypothetical protein